MLEMTLIILLGLSALLDTSAGGWMGSFEQHRETRSMGV
ncbi:unnamed protein product [Ectocarpus sp. 13 AM-2016]